MQITVCYFAAVRERLGAEQEVVELPGPSETVETLWTHLCSAHPQLAPMKRFLRFSLNLEFVGEDAALADGDEVALIPPIAGGSGALLSTEPLDETAIVGQVERADAGAVVTFRGVVRNHSQGRDVAYLEYEAYPLMAEAKLRQVIEEVEAAYVGVRVALCHRIGRLDVGDVAVFIAVSSAHRESAFLACKKAIDRIKEIVPIWKKEVGPDGASWVGMGP